MNERIKDLIEQCTDRHFNEGGGFETFDKELFANLIVGECLDIVKSNTYGPAGEYDYSYSDENAAADDRAETIYKEISYRFGVQ
jgi:hypothetical protein